MNKLFKEIIFRSKISHHCYESGFSIMEKTLLLMQSNDSLI